MSPPFLMGVPFAGIVDPLGSLADLSWRLPRLSDFAGGWNCDLESFDFTIMGGPPGRSYDVTCRFRGVVETKLYTGGTNDGAFWQIGGTPEAVTSALWNMYRLTVSSPSQTFYLNRATSFFVSGIDYTKTIQIDAGATVELYATSADSKEAAHSISVAGVTDPAQPYLGQWINMEVTNVALVT